MRGFINSSVTYTVWCKLKFTLVVQSHDIKQRKWSRRSTPGDGFNVEQKLKYIFNAPDFYTPTSMYAFNNMPRKARC